MLSKLSSSAHIWFMSVAVVPRGDVKDMITSSIQGWSICNPTKLMSAITPVLETVSVEVIVLPAGMGVGVLFVNVACPQLGVGVEDGRIAVAVLVMLGVNVVVRMGVS